MLDVVPFDRCLVRRVAKGLQFFLWLPDNNVKRFAGHDMEQFVQFVLAQAGPLGIEGKVLYIPTYAMLKPGECTPFKLDSFGTPRVKAWLKIKLEPAARVVAVRVDNLADPDADEIWLFAKPEDPKLHAGQFLRYVGNAGDHPVLQRFLEGKLAPLSYETNEEKRVLYQPKRLMDLAPGAVIARVISAGITPRDMLTGIKIYGTQRVEGLDAYRITPDDYFHSLDPIEPIARTLPHLVSIRAGIEAMMKQGGGGGDPEDDDPLPRPDLKRNASTRPSGSRTSGSPRTSASTCRSPRRRKTTSPSSTRPCASTRRSPRKRKTTSPSSTRPCASTRRSHRRTMTAPPRSRTERPSRTR
jgi:hypothetical protein